MIIKRIFCFFLVLFLLVEKQVCCIQVFENSSENVTITEPLIKDLKDENTTIRLESEESKNVKNESESSYRITTLPTITTTHKIPPTLINMKFERNTEKPVPEKSLKDIVPTVAQFHPKSLGQSIDAKVKQAVIHSKTQAFKNFNTFKTKEEVKRPIAPDQIARPANVQNDIFKDNPKDFLPSPEVSHLFNRDNRVPNHFAPMKEYYQPPSQEVRYSSETTFSTDSPTENRWLGENQSPNDIHRPAFPLDISSRTPQFQQGRNTNINFPYHQTHHQHQYHLHRQFSKEENLKFPSDEHSSDELRSTSWPSYRTSNNPSINQIPPLNFKNTKGTWKWIPEEESQVKNSSEIYGFVPESKIFLHETPLLHETRPQTSRDRPYSFDTPEPSPYSNSFNQYSQPSPAALTENPRYPSDPAAWPSSGSDHLLPTEEYLVAKHEEGKSDLKHLRPSPWKKIIHVLGAAIPIGIIISALTPRIIYVHPNATVPTLQPTLNPSQQFQPPISGQVNGPFPARQRSEVLNDSLMHFLKTMEMQFREKQLQSGKKLDGMCEDRFFCETALMGRQSSADALHRTLYSVALETTNEDARKSGLGEIFAAIKRQSCDEFDCNKI